MPPETSPQESERPLAMQLDLLVDEELPEGERRDLLRQLDLAPAHWRDLSLRFLERQVERKSVRDLMAGGHLLPNNMLQELTDAQSPARLRWRGTIWNAGFRRRVAAALLLAAASAVITFYAMRPQSPITPQTTNSLATFQTKLPGETMNVPGSVPVEVPLFEDSQIQARVAAFSSADSQSQRSPRRSVVIQSDGAGNAILIPVNTLPMKVY